MKISKDVRTNLRNIEYYITQIEKAVKEQVIEDCKNTEVNVNVTSRRFGALSFIDSACTLIRDYMTGIETNLTVAEEQDKTFTQPELNNIEPDNIPF